MILKLRGSIVVYRGERNFNPGSPISNSVIFTG